MIFCVAEYNFNGTAYPAFQLIQLADNRVQLIIPDGEYKYDQLYKDDQGTGSWNHIITLTWFNPKEIFAPTPKISVPSTKSVMTILAGLSVKNSDFLASIGKSWSPVDNFVSATDEYGHSINITEVRTDGSVDLTKAGCIRLRISTQMVVAMF